MTSNDDENIFIMDGIQPFSPDKSLPLAEQYNSVDCTSFSENPTRATTSFPTVYVQECNTVDYSKDHGTDATKSTTGYRSTFKSVRMDFDKDSKDDYLKVLALNASNKKKNAIKNSSSHSNYTPITSENIKDVKRAETSQNKELSPKVIFPNNLPKNQHHLKKAVIVLPKVSDLMLQAAKCNSIKIFDEKETSSSVKEETTKKTIKLSNNIDQNRELHLKKAFVKETSSSVKEATAKKTIKLSNSSDQNRELHLKKAFVKLDILPDIVIKKEKIVEANSSSIGAENLEKKKVKDSAIMTNILSDIANKKEKIVETNGSSNCAEDYLEWKKAKDSTMLNNLTDIANKNEKIVKTNVSYILPEYIEQKKANDATIMNISSNVPEEGKVVDSGDSDVNTYLPHHSMGNAFVKIHNFLSSDNNSNKALLLNSKENEVSLKPSSKSSLNIVEESINSTINRLMKRHSVKNEETDITFVEEKNLREEADKTRETHTVEDADSDPDICIINENINSKANISSFGSSGKKRGRGRPPGSMKRFTFGNKKGLTNNQNYFGSKILKCSECNFKTQYLRQLQEHEAAHPKGRKMKCTLCTFETRIKSCMMYHAVIHSGGKKFKCSKCNFATNNIEVFISHEKKRTFCPQCKKDCHTKVGLNRHLRDSHNVDVYECHLCSFLTASAREMESHTHANSFLKPRIKKKRKTQSSGCEFVCTECRFPAQSHTLLVEHLKTVHNKNLNDVKMDQRKESFHQSLGLSQNEAKPSATVVNRNKRLPGRKRSLKRNVNSKDIMKYKKTSFGELICLKCNFVTDDIVYLKNHLEIHARRASVLSENKDIFKCIFCEFETEYEKMMESHMETHTEQDSDFDFDNESPVKKEKNGSGADGIGIVQCVEEKKYRCSSCDFQSNYIKPFERHKSLHLRRDVFDIIFSPIIS